MPSLLGILLSWFPMLLLIVSGYFLCVKCKEAKVARWDLEIKSKLLNQAQGKVTFNDVAGVEEAKEEGGDS